jgi:hypothetical protein
MVEGMGSGWSGGCRWVSTRRPYRGPSTWWRRRAPGSGAAARSCGAPTCPSWRSGANSPRAATAASTPDGTPAARWPSRWSVSPRRTLPSPPSSSASSPLRLRYSSDSATPTSSRYEPNSSSSFYLQSSFTFTVHLFLLRI